MTVRGVRLCIRGVQMIIAFGVLLLFAAPRRSRPIDYSSLMNVTRGCILYELRTISCPYFHIPGIPVENNPFEQEEIDHNDKIPPCPLRVRQLLAPSIIGLLVVIMCGVDLVFGGSLMKCTPTIEARRRLVYLGHVAVVVILWIGVVVALFVALIVRWPEALRLVTIQNDVQLKAVKDSHPPTTWCVALIGAFMEICVCSIEAATIILFPDNYF